MQSMFDIEGCSIDVNIREFGCGATCLHRERGEPGRTHKIFARFQQLRIREMVARLSLQCAGVELDSCP